MADDPFISDITRALNSAPPPQASPNGPAVASPPSKPDDDPMIADIQNALSGKATAKKEPPPEETPSEPSPTVGGVAGRYAAGVNTKLIASTLGAITGIPTDLANAIITNPLDPKWKAFSNPLPAEWWNQQMGKIGIGEIAAPPRNEAERIAQAAGEATGSALQTFLPAKAGIARAAATGEAASPLVEALGATGNQGPVGRALVKAGVPEGLVTTGIPGQVAMASTAGAAGEVASEAAPDNLKGAARELGSLAGGVGAAAVPAGVVGAVRGAQAAGNLIPPLRRSSIEEAARPAAVRMMESQASDPNAAFGALEDRVAADKAELVPGSKPSTPELANDAGWLGLERVRSRQNPELGNQLTELRAANNEARVKALQGMASPTATPEYTQDFLKEQLKDIDLRNQEEAARMQAAVPDISPSMTPEERGATAKDAAQQAYNAERKKLSDLREAIDPTGTMGMAPDAIKEARQKIYDTFPAEGGNTFGGTEKHLYDVVNKWGDLIPIENALQLRANINGRLRGIADQDPQEAKRLMMLKSGVDDALADTAAHVQATEQQGIQEPQIAAAAGSSGGIASRLTNAFGPELEQAGLGPKFTSDVAQAYSANPAARRAASQDPLARSILDQGVEEAPVAAESRMAEPAGEPSKIPGGPPHAPGGEGVQGTPNERTGPPEALGVPEEPAPRGVPEAAPLIPFTPEARERAAEWNRGYAEMAQKYRGPAAQKLLQPGGMDSAVLPQFWKAGPTGRQTMEQYLNATGNRADAVAAAVDHATFSFVNDAVRDGEIKPGLASAWQRKYDSALSAIPGLKDTFSNAAEAQTQVDQAVAAHLQARNDFTQSVAGKFLKADPDKAIGEVFKGDNRAQKAQELMDQVRSDKAATEGVQRAAIDHIMDHFSGMPMAGAEERTLTAAKLQNFIADNREALGVLFPGGAAKNFDALAEDLQRSQRVAGAKQPGGSDTKELFERGKPFEEEKAKTVPSIIWALIAEHAGTATTGIPGVGKAAFGAAAIGRPWLQGKTNALRLETARVMDEMLRDPEFALQMRRLYPPGSNKPNQGVLDLLGKRITQQALIAAQGGDLASTGHASGGVVLRKYAHGGAVDPYGFAAKRGASPEEAAAHLADIARNIHDEDQKANEAAAELQAKLAASTPALAPAA